MGCALHDGVSAAGTCALCGRPFCDRCLTFDVDDEPACESCGLGEVKRNRDLGSAVLAFVGATFLALVWVGYLLLRTNPLVGGLSAILAIAVGRLLYHVLRLHSVRRLSDP
jgi:hypothetical protein